MRRLAAQGLIALGLALLVMVPVVHFLVPDWAARKPAQVNQQLFLTGTGSFINPATQKVYKNVPLSVSRYITTACTGGSPADSKSTVTCPQGQVGKGDTAVWNQRIEFDGTVPATKTTPATTANVAVYLDVIAFNRNTGAAVEGYGQTHDHQGAQVFFFPFNTQKRTYPLWDVASNAVEPANFVRETTYAGQSGIYEFDQTAERDLGNIQASGASGTVPGSLLGLKDQPSVPAHEIYATNRQIFVSPRTGTIIGESENTSVTGQALDGQGTPFPIFVSSNFTTTPASQKFLAGKAHDADKALDLLANVLPVLLFLVGAGALGVGFFLRKRWAPPPAPTAASLPMWPV